MAKLQVKIEAQNADKVITLIELLDKYQDDLPIELKSSLHDLGDCDACEFDCDRLMSMGIGPDGVNVECDGLIVGHVVSVNKILKRVTIASSAPDFTEVYIYPKALTLSYGNTVILEW